MLKAHLNKMFPLALLLLLAAVLWVGVSWLTAARDMSRSIGTNSKILQMELASQNRPPDADFAHFPQNSLLDKIEADWQAGVRARPYEANVLAAP